MRQIIRNAIFLGGNCSGAIILQATVRGTIIRGKSSRGDFLVGTFLGGNYPREQFSGGQSPGDNCPEWNYPIFLRSNCPNKFFNYNNINFNAWLSLYTPTLDGLFRVSIWGGGGVIFPSPTPALFLSKTC